MNIHMEKKVMEAIEFKTKVKNGAIKIPQKYQKQISDTVKVIIISDKVADKGSQGKDIIDNLLSNPIESNKFSPLSRDEIYERP